MKRLILPMTIAVAIAAFTLPAPAAAGSFEANKCVSSKLKEAGKECSGILKAWSKWESSQDDVARDDAIAKVQDKFVGKWNKINTKATDKGSDCATATASSVEIEAAITAAVDSVVTAINTGMTLPADGKCGGKLVKTASKQCSDVLKNYSKFIKGPDKDPSKTKLAASDEKSGLKFADKFDDGLAYCGNSTATTVAVGALLDGLRAELRDITTVGPNISDTNFEVHTFEAHENPLLQDTVEYEGRTLAPSCLTAATGTPGDYDYDDFSFFVKRGANGNENKVFMHLQGGGACWDAKSCFVAQTTDTTAQAFGDCIALACANGSAATNGDVCAVDSDCLGTDHPDQFLDPAAPGFFDLSDPLNPWHDWTVVFVPTCSGDVYSGDTDLTKIYGSGIDSKPVRHRGYHNARVAEKYMREHFLDPDELVVSGLSAGSAGLPLHQYFYNQAYPATDMTVIYDSFVLITTQNFLDTVYQTWEGEKNFPEGIVVKAPTNEEAHIFSAELFPNTNYVHLTNAFDAPSGQGGFYHVMANLSAPVVEWGNWWESICEWNGFMNQQLTDTAAAVPDNYRYYIASGSVHGMFPSDRAYFDTSGGVPTLVSWIDDVLDRSDPLPPNVTSVTPGTLIDPGDPQPGDFTGTPFSNVLTDVVITCP